LTAWFSDENGIETGYVIDLVNKTIGTGEEGENYRKISNSTSFEELREQAEEESKNKIFDECDQMPSFPGNLMTYLSENVKYPVEAQENGIQGRVVVSFVVEKDGSLSDIRVARSVSPVLDAEAIRVVSSMPQWNPGVNNGEYVRVKYNVPVSVRLQ
jgi:periplasmic protein TonB